MNTLTQPSTHAAHITFAYNPEMFPPRERDSFPREPQQNTILSSFLWETDEAAAEKLLGQLIIEHAIPVIETIIKRKLRVSLRAADGSHLNQDALEIRSDVHATLLTELRSFKAHPAGRTISNFHGYTAVITYHACSKYLRQKRPDRSRLKNRLRYLLTHNPLLSLWESDGQGWLCGLSQWREQDGVRAVHAERLGQLRDNPQALMHEELAHVVNHGSTPNAEALAAIFEWVGGPVGFDNLVNTVAELWGIKDQTSQTVIDEEEGSERVAQTPDPGPSLAAEFEQRLYLQRLWTEISELPQKQRAAILLNLRDGRGRGCLHLFPLLGIATIRQIAATLDIPAEEFAVMWNDLPLEDASIAARLSVTRQQVVNLRKSARERLARRMKEF